MPSTKYLRPIAVLGSSRSQGNTGALLKLIAGKLDMDVIDLGVADITPFDYEHRNIGDEFIPVLDQILQHDDLIFASPVYWYTMSAQMKIFFDRLSDLLSVETLKNRGRALRGKRAHVVSTSVSPEAGVGFDEAFEKTFSYLGMELGSRVHLDCSRGFDREAGVQLVQEFVASFGSTQRV